ncbi:hypothetical protein F5146DRAFT_919225 [Armillaria mellea]|nr:hypothetical protein F5146DRAFT_919225 [Armillaria mellea]
MAQLPEHLQMWNNMVFKFRVPKLHCKAHKYSCQCHFSMNLKVGATQTNSEGIEQVWSEQNRSNRLMKEMDPGSCHDTLDDQLSAYNWWKVGLGHSLHAKFNLASKQAEHQ